MQRFEFNGIIFAKYQKFIFSNVSGLNEGKTSNQTASYLEQDGQDIIASYYEPRTVTMSGYIIAENDAELYALRKQLVNACNGKTKDILRYNTGYCEYFSEAIADIPQFGTKIGYTLPFVIYFNLYNFYWKGSELQQFYVFNRTDKITNGFKLPMVLTQRITKADLISTSDVDVPVKITVYCNKFQADTNKGIKVINHATNTFILVDYQITQGETVIIDTNEMTITSDKNGNIMRYVSEDSTFIKLIGGTNEIEGINYNTYSEIAIQIEYYNLFVGV